MPQPLPPSYVATVSFEALALVQRQKCAMLLARVSNEWVRVEHELAEMFAFCAGASTATGVDTWRVDPNTAAFSAMKALESLSARLSVVSSAFEDLPLSSVLLEQFEGLKADLRKVAGARNNVVHGLWGITDKYPNDIILKPKPRAVRLMRYTENDLRNIIGQIETLGGKLHDFRFRVTSDRAGLEIPWPKDLGPTK